MLFFSTETPKPISHAHPAVYEVHNYSVIQSSREEVYHILGKSATCVVVIDTHALACGLGL